MYFAGGDDGPKVAGIGAPERWTSAPSALDAYDKMFRADRGAEILEAATVTEGDSLLTELFEGNHVMVAPCVSAEPFEQETAVGLLIAGGFSRDDLELDLAALETVAGIVSASASTAAAREREQAAHLREIEALTRALSGHIPICATCKSVREEDGEWTSLEGYISDRTAAQLSQGICPVCVRKLYPGMADDIL